MKKHHGTKIRFLSAMLAFCCISSAVISAEDFEEETSYETDYEETDEAENTDETGSEDITYDDTDYDTDDSDYVDYTDYSSYEDSYVEDEPEDEPEETSLPDISGSLGSTIDTNEIPGWPKGPEVASGAAFVMEESTHVVLYSKNSDIKLYPSSAVKIMTALVALENSSPEDIVTITSTGMSGVVDGATTISAQVDEEFTMEQCLYAITLASANEISLQVAEYIGGSVDSFVRMMNDKAKELGCTNTVFTNPTGLPDPGQYTTAHDLALIIEAAISNRTYQTICSSRTYVIPPTNLSGGQRSLSNNLTLLDPTMPEYYESCIGGKEGYTTDSGSVLACAAERDDMRIISVVMRGGAEDTDDETTWLLDYAFANFHLVDLGRNDFAVKSGGIILSPVDAAPENITYVETMLEDGTLDRQYQFNGIPVGTAIVLPEKEEDNSIALTGAANLKEAKEYSSHSTVLPYYLIAAAGAILLFFLAMRLIKIMKKRK